MSKFNLSWQSFFVLIGLGMGLNPAIAATPQQAETHNSSQLLANLNLPDTDRGQPSSSTGGGKRQARSQTAEACMTDSNKLLFRPILPVAADGKVKVKTAKDSTTFWWHIPENNAAVGEFAILTADRETIHYQVIENINDVSGLVPVQIPAGTFQVGETYTWDFTFACEPLELSFDRSGDVFFYGDIERVDVTQLTISQTPAAIQALIATLRGQDSYLSIDPTEAQALAATLESSLVNAADEAVIDEATLQMVNSRLLWHFKSVADAYAAESAAMDDATQSAMKLELAQLSAFFGLWSDTVNLIASERETMPDDWQSLLEALFPADNPSTVQKEDEIIDLLSAAQSPSISEQ